MFAEIRARVLGAIKKIATAEALTARFLGVIRHRVVKHRRRGPLVRGRVDDLTVWRDNTNPTLQERLNKALSVVCLESEIPIVTGYAQCAQGLMKMHDRGYSEIVFAQIAATTQAREAIIHKEFHLSSADPHDVGENNVVKIGKTSYDVCDHLSNLDMEAIHPMAARILRKANIPLRVKHAFEQKDSGTVISVEGGPKERVEMITGLPVQTLRVCDPDMVGMKGYDATILEALTKHDVWIVSKQTNANTITHHLQTNPKALEKVASDILAKHPKADLHIDNLHLVAAVGTDFGERNVLLESLMALEENNVSVKGAQQGPNNNDVQCLVSRSDALKATKALHKGLVEDCCVTHDKLQQAA